MMEHVPQEISSQAIWIWEWDHANVCRYGVVQIPVGPSTPAAGRSNESSQHLQLKASAVTWLKAKGFADAREEANYTSGRADAWTETGQIAVECGHCDATKVLSAVPKSIAVILMPYVSFEQRVSMRRSWNWQEGEQPICLVAYSIERASFLREHLGMIPFGMETVLEHRERQRRRWIDEQIAVLRCSGMGNAVIDAVREDLEARHPPWQR